MVEAERRVLRERKPPPPPPPVAVPSTRVAKTSTRVASNGGQARGGGRGKGRGGAPAKKRAKLEEMESEVEEHEGDDDEEDEEEDGDMNDVADSWELAAVVQWLRIFGGVVRVREFSAEALVGALADEARVGPNLFLLEIIVKLTRTNVEHHYDVRSSNEDWEGKLQRRLDKFIESAQPFPFPDGNPLASQPWRELAPRTRLQIIYALCLIRIDHCPYTADAISRTVKHPEYTAACLRADSFGSDAEGRNYYIFSHYGEDCYVYRETRAKRFRGKPKWETIATTLEQVKELAEEMRRKGKKGERAMYKFLNDTHIPALEETAARRAREIRKV